MIRFILFYSIFLLAKLVGAQEVLQTNFEYNYTKCGTSERFLYPNTVDESEYEELYRQNVNNKVNHQKSNVIYKLPTVVHIIHDGSPLGTEVNPSDDQIFSQIQAATERFRHQQSGADSYTNPFYGIDTEIELCMSKTDPSGNYTSGVIRYYDPINTNDPSTTYMSNLIWDQDLYNNIIIAKSIGGPCGYANGIYTTYLASCFNPGLICHEIGHHLSLSHTFNQGCLNSDCLTDGDKVCDTPPKSYSGYNPNLNSCSTPGNSCNTDEDDTSINNPYRSVANGGIGDQPDMYANFMDYTGSCWDSFTEGQKARMRFNLTSVRSSLIGNSAVCDGPSIAINDVGILNIATPDNDFCNNQHNPTVTIKNYGSATITTVTLIYKINNLIRYSLTINDLSIEPSQTLDYTLSTPITLTPQDSILAVSTYNPNGQTDQNVHNDQNYGALTYIGGDLCISYNECSSFNANTASGPGNITTITISDTFDPISDELNYMALCVSVNGDASYSGETFNISIENGPVVGRTNYGTDCQETEDVCFIITKDSLTTWLSDGQISIHLNPISTNINPTLCASNIGCATLFVPSIILDPCSGSFHELNGEITSNYTAKEYIRANGNIGPVLNVRFQANDSIMLNPLFNIDSNTIFEAIIEDCEEP